MTTENGPDQGRREPNHSTVMGERRHLLNLAYRLLGTLAEAEDVVQETYARWYAQSPQERDAIRSPGAWLTTVAGRICLDVLGSARARRERYVGEWVPEPLPAAGQWSSVGRPAGLGDPADRITLDESVTMAFLVTLEAMSPAERVALILHDVFGYSFPEVANIVGRTPAACRQLASSARRRARAYESPETSTIRHAETVRAFKRAWVAQDIEALLELLDPDATAIADGGGLAHAALDPIEGADQVAHHYVSIAERTPANVTIVECLVNGQPGLSVQREGAIVTVLAFDITGDRIQHIWAVLNPAKLQRWNDDADRRPTAGSVPPSTPRASDR
ncbi:RNA polymerase, sigma-24 subunit, ECF subfamily [Beutenbergia cavernae DSM 12333]|uniref:RNA polymerase, sigma-24 subunit, ECF subfamily n=1 Tax=Beutenbergia cavernae (strain ATCC BAA-8 / DSM 12333 / CCUG 43141 / JCM 11478 / NBRC 16432 / NCIMB 13614 / HKI 0122) TaxID=471853 RepID=C5BX06_BEUC1|nr:RNA polymerase sigma factor SigJ [Beutenbergia cavernae]ACQ78681.1 RNA polymerase, sigma-24 subunit, ECF subfamily [Beutenbergia cavernae DSM 12333]